MEFTHTLYIPRIHSLKGIVGISNVPTSLLESLTMKSGVEFVCISGLKKFGILESQMRVLTLSFSLPYRLVQRVSV